MARLGQRTTLLACPLPSLAAERCCAARAPRVTMGRVRRLVSGVSETHWARSGDRLRSMPTRETKRAAFQRSRRLLDPRNARGENRASPGMSFSFCLAGPDCRLIIGLYGPRFIAVSSKQAAWLADATNSTLNRGGQIAMRRRFSPVGWPGAPASSSVRSPIAEKGEKESGTPPPSPLSSVRMPRMPSLEPARLGRRVDRRVVDQWRRRKGMNMSKLSAHATPSPPVILHRSAHRLPPR